MKKRFILHRVSAVILTLSILIYIFISVETVTLSYNNHIIFSILIVIAVLPTVFSVIYTIVRTNLRKGEKSGGIFIIGSISIMVISLIYAFYFSHVVGPWAILYFTMGFLYGLIPLIIGFIILVYDKLKYREFTT